jgi:WD40 repeat protein
MEKIGKFLITASADNQILFRNLESNFDLVYDITSYNPITCISSGLNENGDELLLVGQNKGDIDAYKLSDGKKYCYVRAYNNKSVRGIMDGRFLVNPPQPIMLTLGDDGAVSCWQWVSP